MRKKLLLMVSYISILSPFFVFYLLKNSEMKEIPIWEIVINIILVSITIFLGIKTWIFISKKSTKGSCVLINEYADESIANEIMGEINDLGFQVIHLPYIYMNTYQAYRNEFLSELLKKAKCAIAVIGPQSHDSGGFNFVIKEMKKSGKCILGITTSADVEIPKSFQNITPIVYDNKHKALFDSMIKIFLVKNNQ